MADNEDGLDLLLALADDPEGCQHADASSPTAPRHDEGLAAEVDNGEDAMDIFCRLAEEAEDAMVPGSPGAADVPFDTDNDEPTADARHGQLGSQTQAVQSRIPLRPDAQPHSAPPASTSTAAAAGRSAFLGIKTGKDATALTTSSAGWVEKRTGLRVKSPKYSSVVLNERLSEVAYISLGRIAEAAGRDAPWGVVGVLSEKLPIRASSSGNPYSLWVLSDLNGASVKLFLFGEAHDEHRQLSQGSLLAAWGGKVRLEGTQPSLTLTGPEQLTHIGTAADFGTCRSTRKDGLRCTVGVNVAKCPFCDFHVSKEYRKMAPRRGGFTDSLLPTGFSRSSPAGQPYAGGRRMVSTKLTAAAPAQPRIRQHSAADMAALAARDIGRRDGVGRRYMLSQAQAVAQHVDQGSGGRLPPVRALASSRPAAKATGASKAGGGAQAGDSSSTQSSGGGNARQHAAQGTAASNAATAAAPAGSAKRKSPDGAARDPGSCSHRTLAPAPVRGVPRGSSLGTPASEALDMGGPGGTELMELEAEGTLEDDEAVWQRPQQRQQQPGSSLSEPQRRQRQHQQQQQRSLASRARSPSQPGQEQRRAMQQQQPNQQRRPPTAAYQRAVAAMRRAGDAPAAKAGKRPCTRPPANPNLPQLMKRTGPDNKRYDMLLGPGQGIVSTSKARAPLAARLDAAEAGRSVAALAGERARQQKRVAAAAPASFAAAFAGIGTDEAQQSRYQHLADAEEDEELLRVMDGLDRKDSAASRMDDIKVQKVKAWHCTSCKYTAEFAAKTCRDAGHVLERLTTNKRWWRCNGCGHHFATVAVRYPTSRCPKCDSAEPSFKAASMLRGSKGPQELPFASRDGLKARGTEHGFCLKC